MRTLKLLTAAGAALSLTACAPDPAPARSLARAQVEAAGRVAVAGRLDAAALRAAVRSLLDVRRAAIATRIASDALGIYLDSEGEPDVLALQRDIDAGRESALTTPVYRDLWSRAEAEAWLADFARAHRAVGSSPLGVAAASSHPLLRAHDEQASALLGALDERAAATRQLAQTAAASSAALADYLNEAPVAVTGAERAMTELWQIAVLDELDDPEKRAAAERALDEILTFLGEKQ